MSDVLRGDIVSLGEKATEILKRYLAGDDEIPDGQVEVSLKILSHSEKIMSMDQSLKLRERDHALRLLKFLPDQKSKRHYMELMNPTVAGLMVKSRPEG